MKYASSQYAAAFYEILKGKNEEEKSALTKNFLNFLKVKKDLKKIRFICEELKNRELEEKNEAEANLTTIREISKEESEKIRFFISSFIKKSPDKIKIKNSVDKNIIGGFKVKINSCLIDASINNFLSRLKRKLR